MLLAMLMASPTFAIDPEAAFKDPAMQQRYERLTQELRCLVCQNQTIADSNAPLAADLRREVRELMESGKSDDEIRTFLTARYGDFVLYRPPVTARTYLLWGAPVLLLLVGLGVAIAIIRRRVQAARSNPASLEEEPENT
jgi:cytochrome c-type biogenesis protein CcmH